MRFGSVCSGIEAASVAWRGLGWEPAWLAEVDVSASAVLAHRFGATAPKYPMEGTEKSLKRIEWGDRITNWGDMTRLPAAVRSGAAEAPDILCGGTPCFTAGHMVLTDSGYRPIEDLLPGDMVVTHEGRLRRVLRVGSKVSKVGRLKMVGLPDGIICTADHRFLSREWKNQSTKRNGKYAKIETVGDPEWTFASQMPGRQWLGRTNYESESVVFPEGISPADAMLIAGFYLGDGWTRSWSGTAKKAVIFGLNPAKYATFCDLLPDMPHCSFPERTIVKVHITNTKLAKWLECHFGRLSHGKTLPSWALSHPDRNLLLNGYRITDGSDDGNGKWTANTVSKSLAFGIASLVQTLNFTASVSLVKTSDTTSIEGRLVNQRDYWAVDAYPCDGSRKSRRFENHLLRTTSSWSDAGEAKVYDIEVEEDHSFILNGAIVHNCQGFSIAGLRGGLSDPRGQLTLSFVELADAIDDRRASCGQQPCVIFWENVPGVRSDRGNAFGHFLAGLVGVEYPIEPGPRPEPGRSSTHWTWKKETSEHVPKWSSAGVVAGPRRTVGWRSSDAQYFALAQRRERVFVVASAREGFDPQAVLLEFDGLRRDSAPSRETGEDVAGTLAARTDGGGFPGTDEACSGYIQPVGSSRVTWPAEVTATLNAHFGEKMGLEDQHINGGASLFVPAPVFPILEAGARTGVSTTDPRAGIGIGIGNDGDPMFTLQSSKQHAVAFVQNTRDEIRLMGGDVQIVGALPAQPGAKQQCYIAEPVAISVAVFDPNQITSKTNRSVPTPELCHTLPGTPNSPVAFAVALRGREGGGTAELGDEVAGTLRASGGGGDKPHVLAVLPFNTTQITSPQNGANPQWGDPCFSLASGNHPPAVCVTGDITHTLRAEGFDASEDGTGRGQPIVVHGTQDPCTGEVAFALGRNNGAENALFEPTMAVRRLMPVECESLQGFPPNWTLVPVGKGMAADGPRYKQLGNSWAVPCVTWIGKRLDRHLAELDGRVIDMEPATVDALTIWMCAA